MLITLLVAFISAAICSRIALQKGFDRQRWMIYGFLFGLIAVLVGVAKAPKLPAATMTPM